jgi:hypothetical protein
MEIRLRTTLAFLILVFSVFFLKAQADEKKEKLIFVVNTTENDESGGATAPYLDEARFADYWAKFDPEAKVVIIRADSNQSAALQIQNWMSPDPSKKEVVGLSIHSHGAAGAIFNESNQFHLRLPHDLPTVFGSLKGYFSNNARVTFDGCQILYGKSPKEATVMLNSIAESLGLSSGMIYANQSMGGQMMDVYKVSIFNQDISKKMRLAALLQYLTWPVSVPASKYIDSNVFNQGFLFEKLPSGKTNLYTAKYSAAFEKSARTAVSNKLVHQDDFGEFAGYPENGFEKPNRVSPTGK